ncbi:MAG: hypothetical protein ACT4OF_15365 [Caulobacteraceae bacterium]
MTPQAWIAGGVRAACLSTSGPGFPPTVGSFIPVGFALWLFHEPWRFTLVSRHLRID